MNIISRTAVCILTTVMLLACCFSAVTVYAENSDGSSEEEYKWTYEELEKFLPLSQSYITYDDEQIFLYVDKDLTMTITNNKTELTTDYFLQDGLTLSKYDYDELEYSYYLPLYHYIKKVKFNDSIETLTIDDGTFYNFHSLQEVEFPLSLKKLQINDHAFYNNPLKSFDVITDECSIRLSAFMNCDYMKSVYINCSDGKIESYAFKNCASLSSVSLSNCTIGDKAFQECPELKTVELLGNTSLGQYAFNKCSKLLNISMDTQTTEMNNSFSDCPMLRLINEEPVFDSSTGTLNSDYRELILSHFNGAYNVGFLTDYVLDKVQKVIDEYTDNDMCDMQKAKALHDWLCSKLTYNKNDRDLKAINHSDETAFLNDTTQCEGYSRAYNILLNAAGIPTCYVHSSTHAWNVAKIDGHYFHIDTTWDDHNNEKSYDWFMRSDDELKKAGGDHESWTIKYPSDMHSFQLKTLPACPNSVGDVNLDEKVGIADLVTLNKYILGNGTIEPDDMVLADLDFDGRVDAFDLCMLRQKII